jgi:hypothetical protein
MNKQAEKQMRWDVRDKETKIGKFNQPYYCYPSTLPIIAEGLVIREIVVSALPEHEVTYNLVSVQGRLAEARKLSRHVAMIDGRID